MLAKQNIHDNRRCLIICLGETADTILIIKHLMYIGTFSNYIEESQFRIVLLYMYKIKKCIKTNRKSNQIRSNGNLFMKYKRREKVLCKNLKTHFTPYL